MLREWLSGAALLDLPIVAMLLFLFFFAGVLWRVMSRRGISLGDAGRRHLLRIFAARWSSAT